MEYLEISDGKMLLSLSADDMAEYRGSRKTAIRRLMLDLHENPNLRSHLVEEGIIQAKKFRILNLKK